MVVRTENSPFYPKKPLKKDINTLCRCLIGCQGFLLLIPEKGLTHLKENERVIGFKKSTM